MRIPGPLHEPNLGAVARAAGLVHLGREAVEDDRVGDPERVVDDHADEEEGRVQVCRLLLKDLVVRDRVLLDPMTVPRPLPEVSEPERRNEERNREDHHHDRDHRPGLEESAIHVPPLAADHVVQHQQPEEADRHVVPHREADEVCLPEAVRGRRKPDREPYKADHGEHHARHLDPADHRLRRFGCTHIISPQPVAT